MFIFEAVGGISLSGKLNVHRVKVGFDLSATFIQLGKRSSLS